MFIITCIFNIFLRMFLNSLAVKIRDWGSKVVTGTQMQTMWAPWIRDLAETLGTHLAEVKHQGELKLLQPESLAHGRFLQDMIHWYNKWVATPMLLLSAGMLGLCPAGPPGIHPTDSTDLHLPTGQSATTHHRRAPTSQDAVSKPA
jgi:hypothetical protein